MMPISFVRSEMDMIIVFVMPMAATISEMAPRPPSIICFWRACSSIGLRMLSIDSVPKPMALIFFSASATREISVTLTSTDV